MVLNQGRQEKVSSERTDCIIASHSFMSLSCDCLVHLGRGDCAEGLVVVEDDTGLRQEVTQISSSLGGGCPAVPVVHPGSDGLWLLSHKGLVSSLTIVFKPGLHHKTNGRSGIDVAEKSKLLTVAEDDPTRSAEANTAGLLWV